MKVPYSDEIDSVVEVLTRSQSLLFITGAGISADSGLPTYRVFSIGTTSVFPYIAGPVELAGRRGWPSVEINPGQSRVSRLVDIRLPMGAAAALDAIWRRYQEHPQR